MDDSAFKITVEPHDDHAVVHVGGELDLITAPLLREAVEQVERPRVVVDMSDIEFMNSSGLSVLIVLSKRLRSRGGDLVIRGAGPMLTKTFAIAGVDEILSFDAER